MAEQKGILKFTGSLGNLRFYKMDGKYYIATKGGPTREQVLTDPTFQRTRENMSEFGRAGKNAKWLRQAFAPILQYVPRKFVYQTLLSAFLKEIKTDIYSPRGKRGFITKTTGAHLIGTDLGQSRIAEVCYASFTSSEAAANYIEPFYGISTQGATLTIPSFNPGTDTNPPAGATHVRLMLLSTFFQSEWQRVFEGEQEKTPAQARGVAIQDIPLTNATLSLSLTPVIPAVVPAENEAGGFGFSAFGVVFLQEISGILYPLSERAAVQIVSMKPYSNTVP